MNEPLLPSAPALLLLATSCLASACSPASAEWLDPRGMTPEVRADYDVFALRCSKCHSLARPLNSGIDDDGYWQRYVARMRRQPASGISAEDSVAILRFLHVYSLEERRRKGHSGVEASLAMEPTAPAVSGPTLSPEPPPRAEQFAAPPPPPEAPPEEPPQDDAGRRSP